MISSFNDLLIILKTLAKDEHFVSSSQMKLKKTAEKKCNIIIKKNNENSNSNSTYNNKNNNNNNDNSNSNDNKNERTATLKIA